MIDDNHDDYGFWRDEPTRPLERLAARRKPAGPAPVAPTRRPRPVDPQVGRRQHGNTQQLPVVPTEPDEAATGGGLRQSIGHVDPLLRRMGALAVAVALCVPVAMSLRSSNDGRASLQPQATTLAVGGSAPQVSTDPIAASAAAEAAVTVAAAPVAEAAAQPAATEADPTTEATSPATAATPPATEASNTISTSPVVAAQVEAASETTELVCDKEYEVVAGDYWILIAKKVSVELEEVLTANNASTDTPLYPGRTVCLPQGASTPTTAAPAPATTDAPKATTTTEKATTTTVKATTTTVKTTSTSTPAAAAPKTSYTRAEVEAIIRQVWPDDLEDEAVRIATRESNLVPGVRNFCCFGLFQLYYNVHKSWLAQMGVTAPEQLYDPLINAYVAYAMYLKAGGWGPWKL